MFHVPESARLSPRQHPLLGTDATAGHNGAFDIASPEPGWRLAIIASDGRDPDAPEADGWEHVSIHAYADGRPRQRTPTWKEMCFAKRVFWDDNDVVMQLHPRESEYVNAHPYTLHLWRPRHATIPTPPAILVGPLTPTR